MIVILKKNAEEQKVDVLRQWLINQEVDIHESIGEYQTIW